MKRLSELDFKLQEIGKLYIPNPSGEPNLVILFPVTRTGKIARECWNNVLKTIKSSHVHALVVIDKTGTGEAGEYFTFHGKEMHSSLYILARDRLEPIFDSQKYIELDEMLWIQQIHDDDSWEGSLGLPSEAEDTDLFLVNFYLRSSESWMEVTEKNAPPARVIFSAIPALIWNRFSGFMFEQGGHVAGSVDATISTVTLLSCELKQLPNFKYFYSSHHWSRRSYAEGHLRSLSFSDGWGGLASADIAILNRNLDNLSALNFFQALLPHQRLTESRKVLMAALQPTLHRRVYMCISYLIVSYLWVPTLVLALRLGVKSVAPCNTHFQDFKRLNYLIRMSWRARTPQQLVKFIEDNLDSQGITRLTERFDFWKQQISELDLIKN